MGFMQSDVSSKRLLLLDDYNDVPVSLAKAIEEAGDLTCSELRHDSSCGVNSTVCLQREYVEVLFELYMPRLCCFPCTFFCGFLFAHDLPADATSHLLSLRLRCKDKIQKSKWPTRKA